MLSTGAWDVTPAPEPAHWEHDLVLVVPPDAQRERALLWIDGGTNGSAREARPRGLALSLAQRTGLVVARLAQVPNQPTDFGDGVRRYEDDLLAYSWARYLETGDERWPAQVPMTRAAVGAMDAIQDFFRERSDTQVHPERFLVTGASKRGWTTWLAAAVDDRVEAIAPMVIDVLNVDASMRHHHAAYGEWSPAIGDYLHHGIMDWLGEPELDALFELVDPFSHRAQLELPKYLLLASGDSFFLPDSARFYVDQLEGETLLRTFPNAEHDLGGSSLLDDLSAWVASVAGEEARPELSWTELEDGALRIACSQAPDRVRRWSAQNPVARDFRLPVIGDTWQAEELSGRARSWVEAAPEAPARGFRASFLELSWERTDGTPLVATTPVRVAPDVLPHLGALERQE